MKKLMAIVLVLLLMGCQTVPIYRTMIPEFSCPAPLRLEFEYINNEVHDEDMIYLIRLNNMSKMERMIKNLVHIIECYESNLKQIRDREK